MGFSDWMKRQAEAGRQNRIASLERKVRIEEAKAGKSLRRSKPHIKGADQLRAKAERLRES